jgi:hypothetical protein
VAGQPTTCNDWLTGCTFCSITICVAIENDFDPGGSGWPAILSSGGGSTEGGGGNGGGDVDGNGNPACGGSFYKPKTCGPGVKPALFNPYVADSIRLDSSIIKNFPCIKKILDSLKVFSNPIRTAQVALSEIFHQSKRLHVNIKLDSSLTDDAITQVDQLANYPDTIDFAFTVYLNPTMLTNSTQEYIASTIIHEIFHGYIDYKHNQYRRNVIDSTEFKSLFPIYWPAIDTNRIMTLTPTELFQHQVMANNLIDILTNGTNSVNSNPNIRVSQRDSINRALAWGGLYMTTTFQVKTTSEKLYIRSMNYMASHKNQRAPYTYISSNGSVAVTEDPFTLFMKTNCQ